MEVNNYLSIQNQRRSIDFPLKTSTAFAKNLHIEQTSYPMTVQSSEKNLYQTRQENTAIKAPLMNHRQRYSLSRFGRKPRDHQFESISQIVIEEDGRRNGSRKEYDFRDAK